MSDESPEITGITSVSTYPVCNYMGALFLIMPTQPELPEDSPTQLPLINRMNIWRSCEISNIAVTFRQPSLTHLNQLISHLFALPKLWQGQSKVKAYQAYGPKGWKLNMIWYPKLGSSCFLSHVSIYCQVLLGKNIGGCTWVNQYPSGSLSILNYIQ